MKLDKLWCMCYATNEYASVQCWCIRYDRHCNDL